MRFASILRTVAPLQVWRVAAGLVAASALVQSEHRLGIDLAQVLVLGKSESRPVGRRGTSCGRDPHIRVPTAGVRSRAGVQHAVASILDFRVRSGFRFTRHSPAESLEQIPLLVRMLLIGRDV